MAEDKFSILPPSLLRPTFSLCFDMLSGAASGGLLDVTGKENLLRCRTVGAYGQKRYCYGRPKCSDAPVHRQCTA